MEGKGTEIVKAIFKTKSKVEVILPPHFKSYYKVMVSKQCNIGKRIDIQINRREQTVQKQTHANIANMASSYSELFSKGIAFSTNGTEQLVIHKQKKERKKKNLNQNITLYVKIN